MTINDDLPVDGFLHDEIELGEYLLSHTDRSCRWCGARLKWENGSYLKCSGDPSCDEPDDGSAVGAEAFKTLSGSLQ